MEEAKINQLCELGFDKEIVKIALTQTNYDMELAVNLIFELSGQNTEINSTATNQKEEKKEELKVEEKEEKRNEECKMVLCVRTDLKMGKGKMCAQCCHAAVGVYGDIIFGKNEQHKKWLKKWEDEACAKIALKVDSEKDLLALQKEALDLGLPSYLIMDAGRTQIEPGSKTVVSIGPAPAYMVDKVTKHLKLL
eukprot:gene9114-1204_t